MNKKNTFVLRPFLIVAALSLIFFSLSVTPASATDTTEEGTKRADMQAIADGYTNYTWTAINSEWNLTQNTNEKHGSHVDTPDVNYCASHGLQWGCWDKAPAVNVGVPYFWGGSTAIEDRPNDNIPDLHLKPQDLFYPAGGLPPVGYFGEKIAAGAPAGDVGTSDDPAWSYANGVDCIGFVGQVWRTGTRLNMPKALEVMRPLRFQDLRMGDVIQRYISGSTKNHVVLFRNWINYDPGVNGPPYVGLHFLVYEAALKPNKVVVSEYELTAIEATNPKYFRGQMYPTDKVTIKRINYCSSTNCADDNVYEDTDYYPYTYLTPIDVVLVIDRSGSMSGNKLGMAQNSAKMFVDFMRPGDKIGVVSFSDAARVDYPLQEILPTNAANYVDVKAAAKSAIDGITAGGGTAIGAGLQAGQQQLNNNGATDPNRLMVLLSDGAGTGVDQALPSIITDKITVHTLGIGDADEVTLRRIANETGGTYYYYTTTTGIGDIFMNTYTKIYGENVVKRIQGTVAPNSTVEQSITVDSTIGSITFSLNWPGSDLDLTLVRPDGTVINPSLADADPDITYTPGLTYEFYTVFAPQPGTWKLRIFGKTTGAAGENYIASVSSMDGMIVSANVEGTDHVAGQPIRLTANIQDNSLVDPLAADNLRGLSVQVAVTDPVLTTFSFALYDDGLHGDGNANDGIYSNTFANTGQEGSYNFSVQFSGTNNIHGQAFTRESSLSVTVTAPPPDFIFSDGFEAGNFSAWSWATTDGGDLSVTTKVAAVGTKSMQALIDDNNEIILYDHTPNNEKHYSARFYFNPNSVQIPYNQGFYVLAGSDDTSWVFCLNLEKEGANYTLALCGHDDAEAWMHSAPVIIPNAWQAVEVEWQAASGPGTRDGYLRLWINDTLVQTITKIDNDTRYITKASLGVTDVHTGTSGTMYFDAFESHRGSHIGLDPSGPAVTPPPQPGDSIFADNFDSGNLSKWSSTVTDGGNLSVVSTAAYQKSAYGLKALINDQNNLRAIDGSPLDDTHYRARFYFHPNSITMTSGNAHYIFDGIKVSSGDAVARIELIRESGVYKLRARIMNDAYSYVMTNKFTISNAWHAVEIEWQAASSSGKNDGFLKLWIDGVLQQTLSAVDNDTHTIGEIRLGAVAGIDTGTSGSMYFDMFESRRNTYIGP